MKRKAKKQSELNDWLTTGQFGKLVGRTPKTVRIWIEQEFVPPSCVQRINGQYRVRRLAQYALEANR